jgi:hypothetical protein
MRLDPPVPADQISLCLSELVGVAGAIRAAVRTLAEAQGALADEALRILMLGEARLATAERAARAAEHGLRGDSRPAIQDRTAAADAGRHPN